MLTPRWTGRRLLAAHTALLLLAGACHSSDAAATTAPAPLRVGGSYPTAVSLAQSSCTGITVQANTTIVSQTPGSTSLSLTHAGITYTGTVQRNGVFAMEPRAVDVGGGVTHTLTIGGTFTATGFTATIPVQVRQGAVATCAYAVQ